MPKLLFFAPKSARKQGFSLNDPKSTKFQPKSGITYENTKGKVKSYKQVACINRPRSARAVANACEKTSAPVSYVGLLVDGSLGLLWIWRYKNQEKALKKEGFSL